MGNRPNKRANCIAAISVAGLGAAGIIAGACATGTTTGYESAFGAGTAPTEGGPFEGDAGTTGDGGATAASGDANGVHMVVTGPGSVASDEAGLGAGNIGTSDGPSGGDGPSGSMGAPNGDPAASDSSTCASSSQKGQRFPLDIFIMMDQSGSMLDSVVGPGGTMAIKWDLLKQALTAFVQDPKSAGIGIGIQYFPIPSAPGSSCDAGTYAVTNDPNAPPSGVGVGIAPLPQNATAIVNSLNAHAPGGSTPTVPALTGALEYAMAWGAQNPDHKVVVVLATDGVPHGSCSNNTVATAAAVAEAGAMSMPPIRTYVIGIGDSLTSLTQIAQGGGTAPAFIVSPGQDVAAQFLTVMNQIRANALVPCDLAIPSSDGGVVDFGKVNVVASPADGGASIDFVRVQDSASCGTTPAGWFYDDPATPTRIHLCPATCDRITQDVTDEVDILLGCASLVPPPPPR